MHLLQLVLQRRLLREAHELLWVTMCPEGLQQADGVCVVQPCLGAEVLWERYAALLQRLLT